MFVFHQHIQRTQSTKFPTFVDVLTKKLCGNMVLTLDSSTTRTKDNYQLKKYRNSRSVSHQPIRQLIPFRRVLQDK